jgi:hypothetical protein
MRWMLVLALAASATGQTTRPATQPATQPAVVYVAEFGSTYHKAGFKLVAGAKLTRITMAEAKSGWPGSK